MPGQGTALLTDQYELTMLQGALHSGAAGRRTIFEVFARHLPHGRRYGVVAGTGRLLDALEQFRFDAADLEFLRASDIVDDVTLRYLESYRFTGNIWGYGEGDCYFPGSPILVVEGTFAEAVVLETISLSILNHDCAIASAASRMVTAAGRRPLIEMGSRRTHEQAAVASARAAYLVGFASTSNLQANRCYGVPSAGTSAHAFTLVHDSERHAFRTQLDALGTSTTLLVDTFDVDPAVQAAVELAGPDLGAVRIDSGDLPVLARHVRALLDELFRRDGQTLRELDERFSMTRFGVMKHLKLLEEAGLVVTKKRGREKLHFLNPVPIRLVHDRWVSKYAEPWAAALSDIKTRLESPMEKVFEIYIRTTPEQLWEAITDSEIRSKYQFGMRITSD